MKVQTVREFALAACVLAACCLLSQAGVRAQEWSRFEWMWADMGEKKFEKGSLYLPVKVKGLKGEFYMQLDTGVPQTMLYGVPFEQLVREQGAASTVAQGGAAAGPYLPATLSGRVGAFELSEVPVLLWKGYGQPLTKGGRQKIGTLGLDIFKERVLILDFPRRRFSLLDKGEAVPAGLERRAQFFEVSYRNGWLFLPVVCDGRPVGDVIYDTGSSPYPLVIRRELWRQLTGRTGDEPDNERRVTYSWGKTYVMTGAPTLKRLAVGPLVFPESTAFFGPAEAPHLSFEQRPLGADGLVGNAPFYDEYTVIIDLPRRRMGLLRSG